MGISKENVTLLANESVFTQTAGLRVSLWVYNRCTAECERHDMIVSHTQTYFHTFQL